VKALGRAGRATAALAVPLFLVALWADTVAGGTLERVAINFFITLVLVYGLQVFSGNSGILSLGHISFMGIGAYVTALLTIPTMIKTLAVPGVPHWLLQTEWGFVPALAAAAVAAAIFAAVIGLMLMRMEENALSMATIALLVIFYTVVEAADSITHGPTGLYSIPVRVTIWIAFGFAIGCGAVALLIRESANGRKLRATRDDPVAAASLGVNVIRTRLWAWVLSAAIMGIGGSLFAQYNLAFDPTSFYFEETFLILSVLIIGGAATVSGATVGAAILAAVDEILRRMEAGEAIGPLHLAIGLGISQIIVAVLILLILWKRPAGLLGGDELGARLFRRRRAPAVEVGSTTGERVGEPT